MSKQFASVADEVSITHKSFGFVDNYYETSFLNFSTFASSIDLCGELAMLTMSMCLMYSSLTVGVMAVPAFAFSYACIKDTR